jgi:2-phosphoglycolate phosphatase
MAATIRAVLFDLDGTLLDTAPDLHGALNQLRQEQMLGPVPYDAVRSAASHGSVRVVKVGFPDSDGEDFLALQRRFLEIYRGALARETRLFEGMDEVLRDLANRRLQAGIVTNKPAAYTEPLLAELGLNTRFACVVSGDTLTERKPHPKPLLHAAALADVSPGECIYVGDAERDVQAAHAAGMTAVVAKYGYLRADEDATAWGGDAYIDRPLDLVDWLEASGRL